MRNSEDETTAQAAARLEQEQSKDTLIAAAAWAGLDTPTVWKSIVVPRIPFPRLNILDEQPVSHYVASRNKAIRRMRQAVGRGLRSPDADCEVLIFDARWKSVRTFVPKRFSDAWQEGLPEGGYRNIELSAVERHPRSRALAFEAYGKVCQVCEFEPKVERQLEVHHLYPLFEGERMTTVDDLSVLCRNCHGLAHSETPPLSIAAMKVIVD